MSSGKAHLASAILLTLSLLAGGATAMAQVYKWQDAAGRVHYSDQPPSDAGAHILSVTKYRGVRLDGAHAASPASNAEATSPSPKIAATLESSQDRGSPSTATAAASGGAEGRGAADATAGGGGTAVGAGALGRTQQADNAVNRNQQPVGSVTGGGSLSPAANKAPPPPARAVKDLPFVSSLASGTFAGPVLPEFFGIHIHRALRDSSWPSVPFKFWRLWDADFATWRSIQPQPGRWDFQWLDRYVALAERNGVELIYTLGQTPTWASARPTEKSPYGPGSFAEPARLSDWEDYVRAVATRYRGRIRYYEIWNEPNALHPQESFFTGTNTELVRLSESAYQTIKEVDPNALVLSPAPIAEPVRFEGFLEAGGGRWFDIVAAHFYNSIPESVVPAIRAYRNLLAKYGLEGRPLWNSETGYCVGRGCPVSSREQQADYTARALILVAAQGLERFGWYSWDHDDMGLTSDRGKTANVSGVAYQQVASWITGARIRCSSDGAKVSACELERGGRRAWIVWSTGGSASVRPVSAWGATGYQTIRGEHLPVTEAGVPLTASPMLITTDSAAW